MFEITRVICRKIDQEPVAFEADKNPLLYESRGSEFRLKPQNERIAREITYPTTSPPHISHLFPSPSLLLPPVQALLLIAMDGLDISALLPPSLLLPPRLAAHKVGPASILIETGNIGGSLRLF